jgi:DNA repair protein RadD
MARGRQVLARFEAGEISVLLNKQLLPAGYDCPAISDVVLASPVRSSILWEQILGRVSRGPAVGGTVAGRVWELDDHRAMHSKVLSYARFLGDLWS